MKDQQTMPTPYELANLAYMVGRWQADTIRVLGGTGGRLEPGEKLDAIAFEKNFDDSITSALTLWKKCVAAIQNRADAVEQLEAIRHQLFEMDSKEFRARIANFAGTAHEIPAALARMKFNTEDLKRRLYPDKNLTRATRDKFFRQLATFAVNHKIKSADGWSPSEKDKRKLEQKLGATEIDGIHARYFFEARQVQIAMNRRHGRP